MSNIKNVFKSVKEIDKNDKDFLNSLSGIVVNSDKNSTDLKIIKLFSNKLLDKDFETYKNTMDVLIPFTVFIDDLSLYLDEKMEIENEKRFPSFSGTLIQNEMKIYFENIFDLEYISKILYYISGKLQIKTRGRISEYLDIEIDYTAKFPVIQNIYVLVENLNNVDDFNLALKEAENLKENYLGSEIYIDTSYDYDRINQEIESSKKFGQTILKHNNVFFVSKTGNKDMKLNEDEPYFKIRKYSNENTEFIEKNMENDTSINFRNILSEIILSSFYLMNNPPEFSITKFKINNEIIYQISDFIQIKENQKPVYLKETFVPSKFQQLNPVIFRIQEHEVGGRVAFGFDNHFFISKFFNIDWKIGETKDFYYQKNSLKASEINLLYSEEEYKNLLMTSMYLYSQIILKRFENVKIKKRIYRENANTRFHSYHIKDMNLSFFEKERIEKEFFETNQLYIEDGIYELKIDFFIHPFSTDDSLNKIQKILKSVKDPYIKKIYNKIYRILKLINAKIKYDEKQKDNYQYNLLNYTII